MIQTELKFMTLEFAKEHIRLDVDYEDSELLMLIASAEQEALMYMERTVEDIVAEHGCIPMPIVNAILIRVTTRFENRSETTQKAVNKIKPNDFRAILFPYKKKEAI